MKGQRITMLGLALAGLAAAAPAQATDGYFAHGYGMKSLGMGGAGVSLSQEPFGGALNPGAMSFLDGNMWEAGLVWFSPRRDASRSGSGSRARSSATSSSRPASRVVTGTERRHTAWPWTKVRRPREGPPPSHTKSVSIERSWRTSSD